MRLFDSHAHLQDARWATGAIRSEMLHRARSAGVEAVVVPAVTPQDWDALNMHFCASEEKDLIPRVFFALGVHPHALPHLDAGDDQVLLERLDRMFSNDRRDVVAVGECGLDYSLEVPRARQQQILSAQIKLAVRENLPLILHCVRAHDDLLELLAAHDAPPSVLHGFTGSAETAARWTRAGHYLGLGGLVTRPTARRVRAAAASIDGTRLLIETDAPDQTPLARRPALNEPSFLPDVVHSLAELRGQSAEDIASLTWANATRLFRIPS